MIELIKRLFKKENKIEISCRTCIRGLETRSIKIVKGKKVIKSEIFCRRYEGGRIALPNSKPCGLYERGN